MIDQHASAQNNQPRLEAEPGKEKEAAAAQQTRRAELLVLFRILMKEPPPEHDFHTCPICKEFGITSI